MPSNLSEQLLTSARVHVDTELSSRLQFILEEFDYVVKDERNAITAREKILAYSGKTEEEEWSHLIEKYVFDNIFYKPTLPFLSNRSEYKDLVLACRDVSDLLLSLSSEKLLEGHLFFIAPKIDFRQSCLPNFLV